MKKFKFKTIGLTSGRGRMLMSIYRSGKPLDWVNLKKSSGSSKSKNTDSKNLAELRCQNFIEIKNQKTVTAVKLTEAGVIECLKMDLVLTDVLPDGLFCVVIFDIPENKRKLRELLRFFLKENCFIPFQKSVWISQFNMVKILEKIFAIWKINQWIKVYIVYEDAEQALLNFNE